jgi:C4-dicarboxylate-specific signal transduction histidine kinase
MRVLNHKRHGLPPGAVYIGRATARLRASKWQNPFRIGRYGDRGEVIAKYGSHLHESGLELITSIAHEISQPLGAIRMNAKTMDLMLGSSSPDLDEIKAVVADIRRDEERATEVIRRIRSLLRKTPFELRDVDLNEIGREAAEFFSALAVARDIDQSVSVTPTPLPIRGDRIQLQQVILNLITNGMDAMSGLPSTRAKVADCNRA